MQPANDDSVLGDFADGNFMHQGVTTRFQRHDESFVIETAGPDGQITTFPVRYAFGVEPLQQYLLEMPDGRLQASGPAWDTRSAENGGQRWFHVYGDEPIDHRDVLHWTRAGAELGFDVRVLSFDGSAQVVRHRGHADVHDDVVGSQCRVRGLSRTGIAARGS